MSRGQQQPVCRFFLEGRCRFGDRCRYRHPGTDRSGGRGYEDQRRQPDSGFNTGRKWDQRGGGNKYHLFSEDSSQEYDDSRGSNQYSRNSYQDQQRGTRYGNQDGSGSRQGRQDWNQPRQNQWSDSHSQSNYRSGPNRYDSRGYEDRYSSGGGYQRGNQYSGNTRGGRYDEDSRHGESDNTSQDDIAELIRENMKEWKDNSATMWPFSCYSYKDKSLPGFVEMSQEELRWEAYCAIASGSIQSYKDSILKLTDEQLKVWQMYANITATDVLKILEGGQSSLFGDHTDSTATSSSMIGTSSMFMPSTAPQPAASAGNSTPLRFGTLEQQSILNQTQIGSSSLFQTSPTVIPSSGLPPQPSQLLQPSQTASPQTTQTPLPNTSDATSVTIGTVNTPASLSTTAGQSSSVGGSVVGSGVKLTAEEIEAFKAEKFVLGHIPESAPPEVFC